MILSSEERPTWWFLPKNQNQLGFWVKKWKKQAQLTPTATWG